MKWLVSTVSVLCLVGLLAERGYHTAHIGKWHLGRAYGMEPNDQGFKESLLMASGLYLPEDHPDVVNSKQDFDPIDRFLWAVMRFAASFNGAQAAPSWPSQISVPINIDKDLTEPDAPDDEYIYWSN
jgi:arylsulfatase A-like enzyme